MLARTFRLTSLNRGSLSLLCRKPHEADWVKKVLNNPNSPFSHVLSLLETEPPSERLAIGTTTKIPPTPASFSENHEFLEILNEVVSEYGHQDDDVISQARAFASTGGFNLGSGGVFFNQQQRPDRRSARKQGHKDAGAGGASAQGGAGGGGRGGYVHLSDRRNPPDFGRIAWPEDILGSVEVDGSGTVVGKVQPSGTYRVLTREGILGLSPFLRGKLVERLKKEEAKETGS
ncbi:Fc.00g098290.m01.CDS01 [Cosmosporella sp. VM-42]